MVLKQINRELRHSFMCFKCLFYNTINENVRAVARTLIKKIICPLLRPKVSWKNVNGKIQGYSFEIAFSSCLFWGLI